MTLPSNVLAERAAIGCILLGGQNTALDAFVKLSDDCFSVEPWSSAWVLIKAMSEAGTPINALTFLNEWQDAKRKLQDVTEVLAAQDDIPIDAAMMDAPTAHNLEYWTDELTALADRRSAMLAAASLSADLENDAITTADAVSRLEDSSYKTNLDRADVLDSTTFIRRGVDDLERRHQEQVSGFRTAIKSGLPDLDRITGGFEPGEFVIVGALASVGKTAFAVTLAENFKEPVLFVSCEMSPQSLYRRYVAVHSRIRAKNLKEGDLVERDFVAIKSSNVDLQKKRFACVDGVAGIKIGELKSKAVSAARRYDTKIIIVDYLQKVRPDETKEKRTYEVGQISEGLQALARKQNLLVIALSQLSRDVRKSNRPPTIADLSDSSQIEKDADMILLLHRAQNKEGGQDLKTQCCVAKARDGETGMCELYFNAPFTRFESISRIDP